MSRDYGRRSQGDLAYGDDFYADRRWDRSRFERERARASGPTFERGPPRSRDDFFEEDRYREVDYYPPRRSRPAFMERDYYETAGREVAPYSHRWEPEREPERPKYMRRQSSWDEHDRRPRPRYGDREAELDVDIRINQQEAPPPRRYYPEDEYRDVRIVRERERSVYRRDRSESQPRRHESSESEEVEEEAEEEIVEKPKKEKKPKRGKTKMPKRLVHKRAIIDLGYPFEEEADFFIVFVAMNKDQIDQAIKISETYRIVYKDDDTPKQLEAPPEKEDTPPESPQNEVVETVTTKIIENPTPSEYEHYIHPDGDAPDNDNASPSPAPSRSKSRRGRSRSTHHSNHGEEEEVEEDKFTTMTIVDRSRRSDRDIKAEIRQLEAERKALRSERDKSRYSSERREVEFDVSERSDRDVVRIEKDSRGRLSLVRSSQ